MSKHIITTFTVTTEVKEFATRGLGITVRTTNPIRSSGTARLYNQSRTGVEGKIKSALWKIDHDPESIVLVDGDPMGLATWEVNAAPID